MKIESLSAKDIMGRFAGYLPVVLAAGIIYWVFIAVAFVFLFSRFLELPTARIVGAVFASVLVVAGMIGYVAFVTRRLSRCFLVVDDSTLTVRAQKSWSFADVQFPLNRIQRIVFGQPLNGMERLLDKLNQMGIPTTSMALNKDLKAGQLLVQDINGLRTVFHFIDKAFDENDLAAFLEELQERGVQLETAA